jgi:Domain of unknown function (DUF4774)
MAEKRGSMEETRRILQEIDRINVALGYTKRMSLAFPRVASGEGYFYPRQQFRPEFLTKRRENYNQNTIRMNNQRAIYPFNNQNYYYPAPYLQLPGDGKSQNFRSNKYFYPLIYAPLNVLPYDMRHFNDEKGNDGSIKLGTIVVLPKESNELNEREPKAVDEMSDIEIEKKATRNKTKPGQAEPSLIDQIVNYVPDALGLSDEDEDERQESVISTTRLPAIKNDKFLNLALKKHPHESDDSDRKLPPPLPFNANRAFNFSNPIEKLQNFTKQFSVKPKSDNLKETTPEDPSTMSPEDLEDAADEKAENAEDEKSPFGFAFGPKQQLQTYKEGGLIIQRLKVRRGGIAIAGPGGVATAGSGGTAIVGPNGIAFTHPRYDEVLKLSSNML